jgi:hypothetical protein
VDFKNTEEIESVDRVKRTSLAAATGRKLDIKIDNFSISPNASHQRCRLCRRDVPQYPEIEKATGAIFYFANPHHSWERGTNENTNGLIRQYIPKGASMKDLTQAQCDRIAKKLNTRPRKRHGFKTPEEILYGK